VIKIGDAVPRFEDERLLKGQGSYTDDAVTAADACLVLVRSPMAAAKITAIDLADAKSAPGVLGVFSHTDLTADDIGVFTTAFPFTRPDGQDMHRPRFGLLAKDVVRFVGDPVVAVIAETQAQAEDAAERVMIDYEDEAAVTDARMALLDGAPTVWPEVPGNIAFVVERGDKAAPLPQPAMSQLWTCASRGSPPTPSSRVPPSAALSSTAAATPCASGHKPRIACATR
jgi:aerobic carbon-monoxide dehydrogenase large subunit